VLRVSRKGGEGQTSASGYISIQSSTKKQPDPSTIAVYPVTIWARSFFFFFFFFFFWEGFLLSARPPQEVRDGVVAGSEA